MNESDLKRWLVASIRAQGGVGRRIEDKYALGWPDLVLIPCGAPVFFAEAKLIRTGAKLVCTKLQQITLHKLWRPPHSLSPIIAYAMKRARLYIGNFDDKLDDCLSVPRPSRLDSHEWPITELLQALDKREQFGITKQIEPLERRA